MNHRSLAFRLGVWYALLLCAAFALIGAGMFYGLKQYLRATLADSLRRRSAQIEQILHEAPAGATDQLIAGLIETRVAPEFNNRFVRVTRAPGSLVYRSNSPSDHSFDAAAVPPMPLPWPTAGSSRRLVGTPEAAIIESATPFAAPSGRYLIELGSSLEPIEAMQGRLLGLLILLLPALVACAATGGYLLVGWALRPVDRIAQSAEEMIAQDLDARLPVLPSGDAIERLSISVNRMLGRLRDSLQTSRRFLADASHELRTPLTVIKGELQETLRTAGAQHQLTERIGSVLEEVARLEHLVSGLLVLSRLDVGEAQRELVDVDVAELAAGTAEQMRLLAEDRGVQLECLPSSPVIVRGDRARLKQVIVNLLDNAIRFTARGGQVTVRAGGGGDQRARLEVQDTGIGIPASALPHIFDRFYRADEARSREDGGAGLGLSIVHSICSAHGAQIEVDSTVGRGTCFRVSFPR
jgi:heavy metal sensor kinase